MNLPDLFASSPVVYVFENEYQIIIPLTAEALCWVNVGGRCYYDHFAGVLRSGTLLHRCIVPQEELDRAREYTVYCRKITARTPYYPQAEEPVSLTVAFRPVPAESARFYHISDAHSKIEPCIRAAGFFKGGPDALILNGDIPNHCGDMENRGQILKLAGAITGGGIPVVFARGNHDARGSYAEGLEEEIPHRNGRTYYTFRLGNIWGLCLDCGEDKADTSEEYGGTICFHPFREQETAFIQQVIERAQKEYRAPGVRHRIVIAHHPFSFLQEPPFDIEAALYREWCRLLREQIRPDLMLCGHTHEAALYLPGGPKDHLGQPCPVIIGGKPGSSKDPQGPAFTGAALTFAAQGIEVAFTDDRLGIAEKYFFESEPEEAE